MKWFRDPETLPLPWHRLWFEEVVLIICDYMVTVYLADLVLQHYLCQYQLHGLSKVNILLCQIQFPFSSGQASILVLPLIMKLTVAFCYTLSLSVWSSSALSVWSRSALSVSIHD